MTGDLPAELPPGLQPNPIRAAAPVPSRLRALATSTVVIAGLWSFGSLLLFFHLVEQRNRPLPVYRVVLEEPADAPGEPPGSGPAPGPAGAQEPEEDLVTQTHSTEPTPLPDPSRIEPMSLLELRQVLEQVSPIAHVPKATGPVGSSPGHGIGQGIGAGGGGTGTGTGLPGVARSSREGEGEMVALKEVEMDDYVPPTYPPLARLANLYGDVVARVTLDEKGKMISYEILSGHEAFLKEVNRVLPLWKFRPVRKQGQAIRATFEVTIRFTLL